MTEQLPPSRLPSPQHLLFFYELLERKYFRLKKGMSKDMRRRLFAGLPLEPQEQYLLSEITSTFSFYTALSWCFGLPVPDQKVLDRLDIQEMLAGIIQESTPDDLHAANLRAGGNVHSPVMLDS